MQSLVDAFRHAMITSMYVDPDHVDNTTKWIVEWRKKEQSRLWQKFGPEPEPRKVRQPPAAIIRSSMRGKPHRFTHRDEWLNTPGRPGAPGPDPYHFALALGQELLGPSPPFAGGSEQEEDFLNFITEASYWLNDHKTFFSPPASRQLFLYIMMGVNKRVKKSFGIGIEQYLNEGHEPYHGECMNMFRSIALRY
jgi:hypothetical protein